MCQRDAPTLGVLEISVFGRGYGECITIHLPNGKWIVVDSYVTENSTPIALDYFEKIGVSAKDAVDIILLTHWHDDHIRGAAKLVEHCTNAQVALSGYLQTDEFQSFLHAWNGVDVDNYGSGLDQLHKILTILKSRQQQRNWCQCNTVICEDLKSQSYQFLALSPSNYAHENQLINLQKDNENRLPCISPNNSSVATVLRVGNDLLLFGADLENGDSENQTGWANIIKDVWKDRGKSCFFKIAHHGSVGAMNDTVWNEMLETNVIAALTPWNRGKKLPTQDGVTKITSKTNRSFSAAKIVIKREKANSALTDKMLRLSGIKIFSDKKLHGHIRLRKAQEHDWSIDLFGEACALKDIFIVQK